MNFLDAAILGVLEGLTEFLPISSSGHLILAREVLGINVASGLAVDAVFQLASIAAVGVYFWRDLWGLTGTAFNFLRGRREEGRERTLFLAVLYGTLPAFVLGLFLESYMQTLFRSASLVAGTLILGGILLLVAERLAKQDQVLTSAKGFWIGCAQALALVPGISRSGATISAGLILGLSREEAARFSFILSFPIILGSGLKKLLELLGDPVSVSSFGLPLLFGSLCAFVVGLSAIHLLIRYLRTHTLNIFAYYRFALAAIVLMVVLF